MSATPDETERAFADALTASLETGETTSIAQLNEAIALAFAIQRDAIVGSAVDVMQGLANLIESKVTVHVMQRDPERAVHTIVATIRGAAETFGQ